MGNSHIISFARTLGISDTQLKRILNGYWDNPTVAQLKNFCEIFKFEPDKLDMFGIKEELIEECKARLSSPSSDSCIECINNLYKYTNGLDGIYKGYNSPVLVDSEIKDKLFNNKAPLNIYPDFVSYGDSNDDFISYFYIPYKIFEVGPTTDIRDKVEHDFPKVQKVLLTILSSELFQKTIIVTSSKRVYLLLSEWITKHTNIKTNKKLILAHSSIEKAYEPKPSYININK